MKIALVTGANRGIGLETCKQLARLGFKVYMGCRSLDSANKILGELVAQKLNVIPIKMDVTKVSDVRSFLNILKNENETLDVLVNNAGVFLESDGPQNMVDTSILQVDPVIVQKIFETNTIGALNLIQAIVPSMKEKGTGRIINVSSGMGALNGMQGHYPGYRLSKTALNALTCILAAELIGTKIKVNSVCPGWVRTDMGGSNATRSVEEGAATIIWLATVENSPSGGFFRDKTMIPW